MNILQQSQTRILSPGLPSLPPGIERYRVHGGGATVVALRAGDRIDIANPEGLQVCELAMFTAAGANSPGMLGVQPVVDTHGIARVLAADNDSALRVKSRLKSGGINISAARGLHLFSGRAATGASESFTAEHDGTCVVAAPGGPMRADAQDTPTDLIVFVYRADPERAAELATLPEPLADPGLDARIAARTAHAYEVAAGEYIQIIDVQGRQCSDLQCFDARDLDRGLERCLDATTTRTLMRASYPGPGLHAKFYDVEQRALLEIIRDTCGRHDSFGLACTAKYYSDMGYPGHVNCSDNFNTALAPHGVAARRGWATMNLFFNTTIDDHNQMFCEEPWSRPGDYVLLRALRDIVCVSSACPDDIDAANGWNPTDIQVRVYPAKTTFKRAIAYRMTTDADPQMSKETGFHPRTAQHTRDLTEYAGYWLANSYTQYGAVAEYWACRERAVLIDLSPLRKYEVLGPDAETLLQTCVTRNVRRLAVGQVVYTAMCYDTGGMIDDGTVFRLGQDNFRWIGGSDQSGIWLREQAQQRGLHAWVRNSTDQLHNLQVQGPNSRAILKEIIWTRPDQPTLAELQWFRFAIARLGDEHGIPIIASRTGYTGELGYEIFCHPNDAPAVWDAIWEAGQPHGLAPLGLQALDTLRIEAGLIFAGYEFDDQTDPFEAGIPFTVPLQTKEDDFIGREALHKRKAHPQRVLVGLELHGEELAAHGDCVHVGRNQVGVITSGTRSPVLKKNLALCRMAIEYSALDTEVEVGKLDGHQKRLPARVVRFPFYDPDKARVRA